MPFSNDESKLLPSTRSQQGWGLPPAPCLRWLPHSHAPSNAFVSAWLLQQACTPSMMHIYMQPASTGMPQKESSMSTKVYGKPCGHANMHSPRTARFVHVCTPIKMLATTSAANWKQHFLAPQCSPWRQLCMSTNMHGWRKVAGSNAASKQHPICSILLHG